MTEMTDEDYGKLLYDWRMKKLELAKIKAEEANMRNVLASHYFPTPKYGVNKAPLGNGYQLKGTLDMNIKVDEEIVKERQDYLDEYGIPDEIWRTKKELNKGLFNQLDERQQNVVNACLIVKPGSFSLEIIEPKK